MTRYCALKKHGSPGESGDSDPVLCFEETWVTREVSHPFLLHETLVQVLESLLLVHDPHPDI